MFRLCCTLAIKPSTRVLTSSQEEQTQAKPFRKHVNSAVHFVLWGQEDTKARAHEHACLNGANR